MAISRDDFLGLRPFQRGYVVYLAGARDDEPNVPDETNPYDAGSADAAEWDRGATTAAIHAQEAEDG